MWEGSSIILIAAASSAGRKPAAAQEEAICVVVAAAAAPEEAAAVRAWILGVRGRVEVDWSGGGRRPGERGVFLCLLPLVEPLSNEARSSGEDVAYFSPPKFCAYSPARKSTYDDVPELY